MILNIGSVVGYSNNLKQATQWMKLGVNTDVNPGTKKASLRPMAGGPSKINPPNSHPSNPIYKQATQAQGLGEENTRVKVKQIKQVNKVTTQNEQTCGALEAHTQTTLVGDDAPTDLNHVNKAIAAFGAVVLVYTLKAVTLTLMPTLTPTLKLSLVFALDSLFKQ